MSTTRLFVLRHGETAWNSVERLQGHLNSPLSPKGEQQVNALAERFGNVAISGLYSSDLGRAQQSASPIARVTNLQVTLDVRLRERGLGLFEGLTRDEARQRYPDIYRVHDTHDADFEIPGGQSLRAHARQVLGALHDIASRHLGQSVVLVTHGGALSAIFRACVGVPLETPRGFSLGNAALNVIDVKGTQLKLVTWGDTLHLASLESESMAPGAPAPGAPAPGALIPGSPAPGAPDHVPDV